MISSCSVATRRFKHAGHKTYFKPAEQSERDLESGAHCDEPIFITRNGEGDMVVMSMAHYSKLQLKLDLFSKLAVAQAQRASGDKGRTVSQVMKDLRKRMRTKSM